MRRFVFVDLCPSDAPVFASGFLGYGSRFGRRDLCAYPYDCSIFVFFKIVLGDHLRWVMVSSQAFGCARRLWDIFRAPPRLADPISALASSQPPFMLFRAYDFFFLFTAVIRTFDSVGICN
jgi:hypothetical protein